MNAAGMLPDFTGVAVGDAWAPYDTYTGATHALCNAHLLRELAAVIDTHPDEEAWCWAEQARCALLDLKTAVDHATDTGQNATGALAAKHRALARRIRDRLPDHLRCTTDFTVPFDNNAAEREIRMAKLRQKISGSMRTLTGARHFAAIHTATATKHGTPLLDALTQLTSGNPWIPENT